MKTNDLPLILGQAPFCEGVEIIRAHLDDISIDWANQSIEIRGVARLSPNLHDSGAVMGWYAIPNDQWVVIGEKDGIEYVQAAKRFDASAVEAAMSRDGFSGIKTIPMVEFEP